MSLPSDPLHQLARADNLETAYEDDLGRPQESTAEAILAVLRVLGAPLSRVEDASPGVRPPPRGRLAADHYTEGKAMTAWVLVVAGVTAGDGGTIMGAAGEPVAVNFEACAWEGTFRTADGEPGRAEWRDSVIRLHHPLRPGRVLPVLARGTPGPGTLEVGRPDGRKGRWYAACRGEAGGISVRLLTGGRTADHDLGLAHPAPRRPQAAPEAPWTTLRTI